MKTRKSFKRFCAFLLAFAMIICEMPAISAKAAESNHPFVGGQTFNIIDDDEFTSEIGFGDYWMNEEEGVYCANVSHWFPENERLSVAEFGALYSKLQAEFKVIDFVSEGTVCANEMVVTLSQELPEEEQTDDTRVGKSGCF